MQLFPLLLLFAAPPEQDYAQAAAELDAAIEGSTSDDHAAAIEALAAAIRLSTQYPDEAVDDGVSDTILQARVILVRLYIAEGDVEAATAAMDDLIRTAAGKTPPVRSFGPEVAMLYEERLEALQAEPTATLSFECEVECDIVVNERRLEQSSEALIPGSYRVWVKASAGEAEWVYQEVEVGGSSPAQVVYEDPTPPPPPPPPPAPPPPKPKRMLPRAAEITGLAVGVGVLVAGAVLLSFDGKCTETNKRPTADITQDECGDLHESTAVGAALMGVGGGVLVVSGVMLTIDEVRVGRAKGQQVMLGVTLRF